MKIKNKKIIIGSLFGIYTIISIIFCIIAIHYAYKLPYDYTKYEYIFEGNMNIFNEYFLYSLIAIFMIIFLPFIGILIVVYFEYKE